MIFKAKFWLLFYLDNLGTEFAGKVLEVSKDVKHLQTGDAVVCFSPKCGGFAEECVVDNRVSFLHPLTWLEHWCVNYKWCGFTMF